MHGEAYDWVKAQTEHLPAGLKVVEFGSIDINGNVRSLFRMPSRYLGLDCKLAAGVDVVADITNWTPDGEYDVAICCETFEHVEDWQGIIKSAWAALKPGGLFVATCAGLARKPHGAYGAEHPANDEWYLNIDPKDLEAALADWAEVEVRVIREDMDLQVRAVKP